MPGVTSLAEVDKKFVTLCSLEYPERSISVDTLYRKWNAVKADDMKALVDKRNKWKKGTSSIDETIWQAFLYYYPVSYTHLDVYKRQNLEYIKFSKLFL